MTDYANGLYIGLMSGTSMDGIDAVLVEFKTHKHHILASYSLPWPHQLKQQLQKLSQPSPYEIDIMGELDSQVADCFSTAVLNLLSQQNLSPKDIQAIGSHGQTIRHRPDAKEPFTLQIGDANRIAEITKITTIADFRRRDIAAGGQGAPLVPAYHADIFHHANENRAILNLGGIANLTLLPSDSSAKILGFDTGPANILMDQWIQKNQKKPSIIMANGRVVENLSKPYLISYSLIHTFLKQHPKALVQNIST